LEDGVIFDVIDHLTMPGSRLAEREASYSAFSRVPGLPVFTTRSAEKREQEITSKKYVLANQTGDDLHTAWYINDKGDKVWLKFDASRPCTEFQTTETRFYKPKLHTILPDPYADKKGYFPPLLEECTFELSAVELKVQKACEETCQSYKL